VYWTKYLPSAVHTCTQERHHMHARLQHEHAFDTTARTGGLQSCLRAALLPGSLRTQAEFSRRSAKGLYPAQSTLAREPTLFSGLRRVSSSVTPAQHNTAHQISIHYYRGATLGERWLIDCHLHNTTQHNATHDVAWARACVLIVWMAGPSAACHSISESSRKVTASWLWQHPPPFALDQSQPPPSHPPIHHPQPWLA
jgi:hypothetical protein